MSATRLCTRLRLHHNSLLQTSPLATFHSQPRPANFSHSAAFRDEVSPSSSSPPAAAGAPLLTVGPPAPGDAGGKPLHPRPQDMIRNSLIEIAKSRNIALPPVLDDPSSPSGPRLPRNIQALYLAPMRRTPTHGIPVCNLQLRSYSVRNVEFMADFALRAAYYLNLPAKGPVPLPRITQRWTVPRSNFVHKKSQENFERVTLRRLVQVQDGHPEAVQRWLAFVQKWCWYGVGMKADVFEFEGLGVAARMDESDEAVRRGVDSVDWDLFGRRKGLDTPEAVGEMMAQHGFATPPSQSPAAGS